jgi:hypothetical protein
MTETNPPKGDRLGDDYSRGPNPNPGGEIDTSGSTVPPYDDRTEGNEDAAEGTRRAMGSEAPLHDPVQPGSEADAPDDTSKDDLPPKRVGESTTRRGEDVGAGDDEPGRYDSGTSGADRPAGESSLRDRTSVDPHDEDGSDGPV